MANSLINNDNLVLLTGILWSQVKMIDTPAGKRDSRKTDSSYDEEHGKRSIAVNVSS